MQEAVRIGTTVRSGDRVVGEVVAVDADPVTSAPARIVVRTADGADLALPAAAVSIDASGDAVLVEGYDLGAVAAGVAGAGDDRLLIPVRVEELEAQTRPVEIGVVRVAKEVVAEPDSVTVDVRHDDVSVERVPVNQEVSAVPQPRWEGDTLIVPVIEEELVVSKRYVLREEVRITRRAVVEPQTVTDTVRREKVRVERIDRDGDGIEYPDTLAASDRSTPADPSEPS